MKKESKLTKPFLSLAAATGTAYYIFISIGIATASSVDAPARHEASLHSKKVKDLQIEYATHRGDTSSKATDFLETTSSNSKILEPIRLVATFVSNDSALSWAFFEKNGSLFLIGQEGHEIADGFFVYKIQNDQVLVKKGSTINAIKLTSSNTSHIYEKSNDNQLKKSDRDDKGSKKDSPRSQILAKLSLVPVSEGSASGYRVTEESFRLIKKHGLEPGDIILSANGHPLGTESSDSLAFKSFQNSNKATVAVLRGSQTIYIDYKP